MCNLHLAERCVHDVLVSTCLTTDPAPISSLQRSSLRWATKLCQCVLLMGPCMRGLNSKGLIWKSGRLKVADGRRGMLCCASPAAAHQGCPLPGTCNVNLANRCCVLSGLSGAEGLGSSRPLRILRSDPKLTEMAGCRSSLRQVGVLLDTLLILRPAIERTVAIHGAEAQVRLQLLSRAAAQTPAQVSASSPGIGSCLR